MPKAARPAGQKNKFASSYKSPYTCTYNGQKHKRSGKLKYSETKRDSSERRTNYVNVGHVMTITYMKMYRKTKSRRKGFYTVSRGGVRL